jgi:hypothetical protein
MKRIFYEDLQRKVTQEELRMTKKLPITLPSSKDEFDHISSSSFWSTQLGLTNQYLNNKNPLDLLTRVMEKEFQSTLIYKPEKILEEISRLKASPSSSPPPAPPDPPPPVSSSLSSSSSFSSTTSLSSSHFHYTPTSTNNSTLASKGHMDEEEEEEIQHSSPTSNHSSSNFHYSPSSINNTKHATSESMEKETTQNEERNHPQNWNEEEIDLYY